MSERDAFKGILASLYAAMLDDAQWPPTSALIDDACGINTNVLLVGEGASNKEMRVYTLGVHIRGQLHEEVMREYLESYHPIDERVPRLRRLPSGRLVHATDLYTEQELKTSPTFNEFCGRVGAQDGLSVRLDGPDGASHITWHLGDPAEGGGWQGAHIAMAKRLLPHIRHFVFVRHAVVGAGALGWALTDLLDSQRLGVIHLDRRGRIVEANDRALQLLRSGDGLLERAVFRGLACRQTAPVSIAC